MATEADVTRTEPRQKFKICLAGEAAVGKTSLIRRFVYDDFQDRYVTTLGAKVTKRVVEAEVSDQDHPAPVVLMIWDIMGQKGIRELLRDAYFFGVQGTLMVCDVTRPETLEALSRWQESIERVAGEVPGFLLVNKMDLEDEKALTAQEIGAFAEREGWPYIETSAKTGKGVEDAFRRLTAALMERQEAKAE